MALTPAAIMSEAKVWRHSCSPICSSLASRHRSRARRLTADGVNGEQCDEIQGDFARIKVPIYEPPDTSALDEAMAARRQRDAERDAAIIATSDATVEVAQAVQALAAVSAQTLAEIATMRRDSRRILYWTAAGVLIALVALTLLR